MAPPFYEIGMPRQKNKTKQNKKKQNIAQRKEQIKAPEKIQLNNEDSQPVRCIVQNTGNQDAHRIG